MTECHHAQITALLATFGFSRVLVSSLLSTSVLVPCTLHGEIGYMDVNGSYIQNIASSKYLVEKVQKEKEEKEGITDTITGVDIFELAKRGDEICIAGINEIISNLAVGVRNIIYLLNPEVIVIGGGITAQKEYLEEKIRKEVNDGMISDMFRKTRIELAQQGNQAGLLGALYNFLNKNK